VIAVSALFLAIFAIIGYLAWQTALGTTGPWFSPTISQQVYSATLISATVLVVGLVAFASAQAAAAARETRGLDLRIAILRGSGVTQLPGVIDTNGDMEDPPAPFLEVPTRGVGAALVSIKRQGHDSLATVPSFAALQAPEVALREFSRARNLLLGARARLRGAVAGPCAMGTVFLGIAGAMLPGSEGFLQNHFFLNTTLILFLGYGWPFLAAWASAGLAIGQGSARP
jgi:hypothetical protein